MNKYKLTDETLTHYGRTLHRIEALISFGNVKAGDKGGWVEREGNLSQEGKAWVYDEAKVYDNAMVSQNARVYRNTWIIDNSQIYGNARVYGNTRVIGYAQVHADAHIIGNVWIGDYAQVYDSVCMSDNVCIFGNTHISGSARVSGNTQLSGYAWITDEYDYITVGPIGSHGDTTTFFRVKQGGIWVKCGCFTGALCDFENHIIAQCSEDEHYKAYKAAIVMAVEIVNKESVEG